MKLVVDRRQHLSTGLKKLVVRILGKSPEFVGVVADYFGDSGIQMKRCPTNNDLQAKICKAQMVGQTSNLVRAMNTSKQKILVMFRIP